MVLQTRPSPSWNVSPDICIIFGFLYNPPPPSSDIFSAVSTKYLPDPYRDTHINIAWHNSQQYARAIHLTADTLPQILVGRVTRAGPLVLTSPDSRGTPTHICSGILTVRFARTATHPQAKVKREESLRASSPQRLNFSRRRAFIPAAVPSLM